MTFVHVPNDIPFRKRCFSPLFFFLPLSLCDTKSVPASNVGRHWGVHRFGRGLNSSSIFFRPVRSRERNTLQILTSVLWTMQCQSFFSLPPCFLASGVNNPGDYKVSHTCSNLWHVQLLCKVPRRFSLPFFPVNLTTPYQNNKIKQERKRYSRQPGFGGLL